MHVNMHVFNAVNDSIKMSKDPSAATPQERDFTYTL
jgi:hypothetical protein